MGPLPHNTPASKISSKNPAGTDGFEFVEFADSSDGKLRETFQKMGFAEPDSLGGRFVAMHGPSAPPWRGGWWMQITPFSTRSPRVRPLIQGPEKRWTLPRLRASIPARFFSSLSSAKAMTVSARATSAPCLKASRSTRWRVGLFELIGFSYPWRSLEGTSPKTKPARAPYLQVKATGSPNTPHELPPE